MSHDPCARRLKQTSLLAVVALLTTSCAQALAPGNELQVVNTTDLFSLTVQNLVEVTDSRSFQWENTGTQASVGIIESIDGGEVLLSIQDPTGSLIYNEGLADGVDGLTEVGTPGMWTVEVNLAGATGSFNFVLEAEN